MITFNSKKSVYKGKPISVEGISLLFLADSSATAFNLSLKGRLQLLFNIFHYLNFLNEV